MGNQINDVFLVYIISKNKKEEVSRLEQR